MSSSTIISQKYFWSSRQLPGARITAGQGVSTLLTPLHTENIICMTCWVNLRGSKEKLHRTRVMNYLCSQVIFWGVWYLVCIHLKVPSWAVEVTRTLYGRRNMTFPMPPQIQSLNDLLKISVDIRPPYIVFIILPPYSFISVVHVFHGSSFLFEKWVDHRFLQIGEITKILSYKNYRMLPKPNYLKGGWIQVKILVLLL